VLGSVAVTLKVIVAPDTAAPAQLLRVPPVKPGALSAGPAVKVGALFPTVTCVVMFVYVAEKELKTFLETKAKRITKSREIVK